jgi:hypothetical protein
MLLVIYENSCSASNSWQRHLCPTWLDSLTFHTRFQVFLVVKIHSHYEAVYSGMWVLKFQKTASVVPLSWIIQAVLGEEFKQWNSSLCDPPFSSVISRYFIFSSIITLFFHQIRDQVLYKVVIRINQETRNRALSFISWNFFSLYINMNLCSGSSSSDCEEYFLLGCGAYLLLALLYDSEDGGSMFLQNVSKVLPDYMASHPRRYYC